MIQGTTPTLQFKLPNTIKATYNNITEAQILISYEGRGKRVFIDKKLTEDEVIIDETNNIIFTELNEEETLKLPAPAIVGVQLRIIMGQTALATEIYNIEVKKLLTNEELIKK